jgi:hypothetical protein
MYPSEASDSRQDSSKIRSINEYVSTKRSKNAAVEARLGLLGPRLEALRGLERLSSLEGCSLREGFDRLKNLRNAMRTSVSRLNMVASNMPSDAALEKLRKAGESHRLQELALKELQDMKAKNQTRSSRRV